MTKDPRKNLELSYNSLNLLSEVRQSSILKAKYTYAADGTKLAVTDVGGNGYDYRGSLIYKNTSGTKSLESVSFSDGRITKTNSTYVPNYSLTDHLGSVRVIFDASGTVLEQNDYYAFGEKHQNGSLLASNNRFKYNGKELQTTGDLGLLDYGARMYDSKLGRWFGQDPLQEKYYSLSCYNYCSNSPTNAVDIDGRLIVFVAGFDLNKYNEYMGNMPLYPSMGALSNIMFRDSYKENYLNYNRGFDRKDTYGWGKVDDLYMKTFDDYNSLYIAGDSYPLSSAKSRYEAGRASGLRLIEELKNGSRSLSEGENIRLVGHSMGGAYAAGMAEALLNSNYKDRLQLVDYLAAHQPDGFMHPNGVLGRQFGSENDRLSASGRSIYNIKQWDRHIGKFGNPLDFGGHLLNDEFNNFLSKCLNSGITITIK